MAISFPVITLHIEPDSSFVAGGAYIPPSPWLSAIREKSLRKRRKS
ncbi:MAG: hypothetical protein U5L72_07505 [Bacteroidales bacterium]|nr:hypothetical protein [Bacteroidales bacterium]